MIKIGIPKGRLFKPVLDILKQSDIYLDIKNDRDYRPKSNVKDIEFKIFKPRAIPQLIVLGNLDAGFTGLDLARESGYTQFGFNIEYEVAKVDLVVAVHNSNPNLLLDPPKRPLLIATEYPNIASNWASNHNLAHIILKTYGATEAYAPEDADIVLDCVETGNTMEANNLVIVDKIMSSSLHLFVNEEGWMNKLGLINTISNLLISLVKSKKGNS